MIITEADQQCYCMMISSAMCSLGVTTRIISCDRLDLSSTDSLSGPWAGQYRERCHAQQPSLLHHDIQSARNRIHHHLDIFHWITKSVYLMLSPYQYTPYRIYICTHNYEHTACSSKVMLSYMNVTDVLMSCKG